MNKLNDKNTSQIKLHEIIYNKKCHFRVWVCATHCFFFFILLIIFTPHPSLLKSFQLKLRIDCKRKVKSKGKCKINKIYSIGGFVSTNLYFWSSFKTKEVQMAADRWRGGATRILGYQDSQYLPWMGCALQ